MKIDTGMLPPVLQTSSSSASSSGDEVVIFSGRSRTQGMRATQITSAVALTTGAHENVFVNPRTVEDRVLKLDPLASDAVVVPALSVRSLDENIILSQPVADDGWVEQNINNGKRKTRTKKPTSMLRQTSKGAFDPAFALTISLDQESYTDLEVIDHDWSGLKTRRMRRQGALPSDVSDTELETHLSSARQKDRLKKQVKKQGREELRAQGLLGKKNKKKSDLLAKYLEGMTTDQIKDEIKAFIVSMDQRYLRPPDILGVDI